MTRRRRRVQALSAAAALAGLFVATHAAAQAEPAATPPLWAPSQSSTRVHVLRVAGSEQLFARLLAELRAQGFDTATEVVGISGGAPGGVEAEMQDWLDTSSPHGAAVALESTPASVRVWVVNTTTGKQVFREAQREPHTDLDNAIVALWAVELLRATGIAAAEKEHPAPHPPVPRAPRGRREVSATADIAASRLPKTPFWSLELGAALEASPGGVSPELAVGVGARLQPLRRFGVEASLFVPLTPTRLARAQSEALVSVALACAGPYLTLHEPGARFRADLGLGAALAVISASGVSSEAPFATAADRVVAAGPYARAGAGVRLVANLGLRVDVLAGAAFPRPVLLFGDDQVARWGRPWFANRVALEVAF